MAENTPNLKSEFHNQCVGFIAFWRSSQTNFASFSSLELFISQKSSLLLLPFCQMGPKFWYMPPIGVSTMFLPGFALAFLQNYHLKHIIQWLTSKYLQNLRSKVFGMKNRIGTFPISYLKPSVKLIQTMFFLRCRRNPTELFSAC